MRLIDADQFDALCEIVDALTQHVERLTKERPGLFAPEDNKRIESIAERAHRLAVARSVLREWR